MTELIKEHFDEQLSKLVSKKDLETTLDQRFDKMGQMINSAFQGQKEHLDERFDGVNERLDKVEERLAVVETKLDRALYTEVVHLETRIKRLEEKVGIKSSPATA